MNIYNLVNFHVLILIYRKISQTLKTIFKFSAKFYKFSYFHFKNSANYLLTFQKIH